MVGIVNVGAPRVLAIAGVVAILSLARLCHAQGLFDSPLGAQQSERHNPSSPGYADFTRGYSQDQLLRSQRPARTTEPVVLSERRFRPMRRIVVAPWYFGPGYWPYAAAYGGDPYFDQSYFAYPPIAAPAENLFGPLAVQRFMGVDPVPRQPQAPVAAQQQQQQQQPNFPNAAPNSSDSKARARAWRSIDSGDAEFKQKHFAQALTRYRDAQSAARDLADACFREGHALLAVGRYSDAYKTYRRGLVIDADWADSDFRLDQIYGDNKLTKSAHIDALVRAVAQHPHDPELLFLLGVYLYFDGQTARSAEFFQRAALVLGPANADHLTGFLKHALPEAKAAPKLPPPATPAPADRDLPPGLDT